MSCVCVNDSSLCSASKISVTVTLSHFVCFSEEQSSQPCCLSQILSVRCDWMLLSLNLSWRTGVLTCSNFLYCPCFHDAVTEPQNSLNPPTDLGTDSARSTAPHKDRLQQTNAVNQMNWINKKEKLNHCHYEFNRMKPSPTQNIVATFSDSGWHRSKNYSHFHPFSPFLIK